MRTKKAFWNIVSSMLFLVINTICGLITPRLILRSFGSDYNGVISSATQFLSMISVLTLGIAGPTRVALYQSLAKEDNNGTSRIVKATRLYMQKVGLAVIVYAVILMVVFPIFAKTTISKGEIALLIGIVSISSFAQYFFAVTNQTLLSADQSEYISNVINIIKVVGNTVLTAFLIYIGASIFAVKLGSSIIFFLCPLALNIYVKHHYSLDNRCEPDYTAIKGRSAAVYHSVANIIHDNTDIVLLTVFTDIKMVSVYTVYNLVANGLRNLMRVFTNSLESPFGSMWAKKETERLEYNFRIYEFGIYFFATVVFSTAYVLITPFIKRYTAGVTDANYVLPFFAFLVITSECIFCIRQPYLTMVQATGNYEATKKDAIAEAIINILTSVILINIIGINGVLVGTIVANLYRTVRYAYFTDKHIITRGMSVVVRRVIWCVLAIFINTFTGSFIEKVIAFNEGWIGWLIEAIIVGVTSLIITIIASVLFYRGDIKDFANVILRMIKRNKKRNL